MPSIEFLRLVTNETPRDILERDFPDLRGRIPIRGGWGYTLEDPCIIDRDDLAVDPQQPFNGVEIEYLFSECRLHQELISFRGSPERYKYVRHQLRKQSLEFANDGRPFDHLVWDVEAFRERDLEEFNAEVDRKDPGNPFLDKADQLKLDQLRCTGETEYWFDITSFFGR